MAGSGEFYTALQQYDKHNERALLSAFSYFGIPESLIDFGCGTGFHFISANRLGASPIVGVEFSDVVRSVFPGIHAHLTVHDLREPLDLDYQFEMVLCWEVAEHIEEEYADILCETLARHTGKWLVFTAGQPEPGGYYHVNEQPKEYWAEKLEAQGLKLDPTASDNLSAMWRHGGCGPLEWLHKNVQVFVK
jgi:hypothetical protein